MYTPQVIDHYERPRNVGVITDADGTGIVGSIDAGETIQLTIAVSDERISDARFKAFGCPTVIAAGSVVTEWIKGRRIDEVRRMTVRQIEDALGGLPPEKRRSATLAEKALKTAIDDWMSRNPIHPRKGG